jgi:hypothetical protein
VRACGRAGVEGHARTGARAQDIAALGGCTHSCTGAGHARGGHNTVGDATSVTYIATVDALVPDAGAGGGGGGGGSGDQNERCRALTAALACLGVVCANPLNRSRLHRRSMLPLVISVADSLMVRLGRVPGAIAAAADAGGAPALASVARRAAGALHLLRCCLRVLGACTGADVSWVACATGDPLAPPRTDAREASGTAEALWPHLPSRPSTDAHVHAEAIDGAGVCARASAVPCAR